MKILLDKKIELRFINTLEISRNGHFLTIFFKTVNSRIQTKGTRRYCHYAVLATNYSHYTVPFMGSTVNFITILVYYTLSPVKFIPELLSGIQYSVLMVTF